jgi:Spy/CpxP family protein refolding chaperone
MGGQLLSAMAAAVLAVGLGVSPAWADKERHGRGDGSHREGHRMMGGHGQTGHYLRHLLMHQKEIGLTGEQVAKIKAIQLALDKTRIKMESDILVAEREVAAMVEDDKTDLAAVEAKIKQSEELEASLRIAAIKARREAWTLLTPEQREKEQAEHERMMRHHREG